jgi:hypothetical protein
MFTGHPNVSHLFGRACGPDGCRDDSAKFAVFRDNVDYLFRGNDGTFAENSEPDGGFVQFLKRNSELVNEIARLSAPLASA